MSSGVSPDEQIGRIISRFRLVRLLGKGGTSSVYLGERCADFEQLAAVKLLREELFDAETRLRFRTERDALAALQHPNIVQLIDGGVTSDGIPYLVTEYVEGIPLDRYCDHSRLGVCERVRLLIPVLDGVEHAHRRLVAHCDLKFSNILVTAEGRPKLLDFGLTRAPRLSPPEIGEPAATAPEAHPFSLGFASPEQLGGQNVTTATDVYSSGVMLYALLTGTHPFESVIQEPLELARAILSAPLEAPSQRIRRLNRVDPVAAKLAAEARGTTPARLAATLRGDLDAIVLKALSKDPEQRYRGPAGLAADLEDFLSGRPVDCRRSRTYRAWKFVERHRAHATAVLVLAAVVLAGTAGALWESLRAQRSEAVAEARFGDARKLTDSLLADFYMSVQKLEGSERARELLVRRTRETLANLARQSGADASLRLGLADTYLQLGVLQEAGAQVADAIASFNGGIDLLEPILRRDPENRLALLEKGRLLEARSHSESAAGRTREAFDDAVQSRELMDRITSK